MHRQNLPVCVSLANEEMCMSSVILTQDLPILMQPKSKYMHAPNYFNQSLPNVMFLLISSTTKNSCLCFSLPISFFSEAHPSTSVESPFTH